MEKCNSLWPQGISSGPFGLRAGHCLREMCWETERAKAVPELVPDLDLCYRTQTNTTIHSGR